VCVIERSSGTIKWSFQTRGPVKSSACVNPHNGYAYIGSHDHHLYAFDIQVLTFIASVFESQHIHTGIYVQGGSKNYDVVSFLLSYAKNV